MGIMGITGITGQQSEGADAVWGGGFIQGDGLGTFFDLGHWIDSVSKYRIIAWMKMNAISQVYLLDSCLPAERREERSKLSLPKQPEAGCNGR